MMQTLFQKTLLVLMPALLFAKQNNAQGIQKYQNSLFVEYGMVQYNQDGSELLGENNNLLSFGLGYNKDLFSFLSIGLKAKHYTLSVLPGTNTRNSNTAQLQIRVQRPRISRSFRLRRFSPYFETGIGQAIEYKNQNVEERNAEYVYVPLVAGIDYNFSNHWALGLQAEYRLSGKDFDAVINDFQHSLNRFNAVSARLSFYFGHNRKRPTAPRIYTRPTSGRTTVAHRNATGSLHRAGFIPDPKVYSVAGPEAGAMQVPQATQVAGTAPATMKITDTALMRIVNPAAVQDSTISLPARQLTAVTDTIQGRKIDSLLLGPALLISKDTLSKRGTTMLVKTDTLMPDTAYLVNTNAALVFRQDTTALVIRDQQVGNTAQLMKNNRLKPGALIRIDSMAEYFIDTIPVVEKEIALKQETIAPANNETPAELKKDTAFPIPESTPAGLTIDTVAFMKNASASGLKRDTIVVVRTDTVLKIKRDTVFSKTDTISIQQSDTVRFNNYANSNERSAPIDPVVKTSVVQTYTPIPVPSGNSIPPAADDRVNQLMEQKVNQLEIENANLQNRLKQSEARNAVMPVGSTSRSVLPGAGARSMATETVAAVPPLPALPQVARKTNTNLVVLPIGAGDKKSAASAAKAEQHLINEKQDSIFNQLSVIQAKLEVLQGQQVITVPVPQINTTADKQSKKHQDSLNRDLQEQIRRLQQENEALQQQVGNTDSTPVVMSKVSSEVKPIEQDLYFKVNQHKLDPDLMQQLTVLSDTLKKGLMQWILLEGFTDKSGSAAYNLELSKKRVRAVKAFLVKQGIAKEMILEKTFGSRFSTGLTNSNDRKVRLTQIVR